MSANNFIIKKREKILVKYFKNYGCDSVQYGFNQGITYLRLIGRGQGTVQETDKIFDK